MSGHSLCHMTLYDIMVSYNVIVNYIIVINYNDTIIVSLQSRHYNGLQSKLCSPTCCYSSSSGGQDMFFSEMTGPNLFKFRTQLDIQKVGRIFLLS